jgi:hypothetical protein
MAGEEAEVSAEFGPVSAASPVGVAADSVPLGRQDSGVGDFVWRFRLAEKPLNPVFHDPLDELLRVQWEELLKLCVPYYDGKPVKVDGFAIMREPDHILSIHKPEPTEEAER